MVDTVEKEIRSIIMSKVGQKNTSPEVNLRKELHRLGLRYRLHDKKMPGSPDLVFPRFKAVIFVHGCFWHRHDCKLTTTPATNREFWLKKFDDNVVRDRRNIQALLDNGWRVAVIWECNLKGKKAVLRKKAQHVLEWLQSGRKLFVCPK